MIWIDNRIHTLDINFSRCAYHWKYLKILYQLNYSKNHNKQCIEQKCILNSQSVSTMGSYSIVMWLYFCLIVIKMSHEIIDKKEYSISKKWDYLIPPFFELVCFIIMIILFPWELKAYYMSYRMYAKSKDKCNFSQISIISCKNICIITSRSLYNYLWGIKNVISWIKYRFQNVLN